MVLSMTLYFQVVNNTRSAENSFLYNSKVILLTGDPSQNERWKQFIMADSFNGLRYYRVHLMQLHHIHVSFFCLLCVMAFKMSAWCVIGAPPFPPPPPLRPPLPICTNIAQQDSFVRGWWIQQTPQHTPTLTGLSAGKKVSPLAFTHLLDSTASLCLTFEMKVINFSGGQPYNASTRKIFILCTLQIVKKNH